MAKKTTESAEVGPPQVPPLTGARLLSDQIASGEGILTRSPINGDEYSSWELLTRNYLEKAFGRDSPNVTSITHVGKYGSFPMNAGDAWWAKQRAESLRTQLTKLRSLAQLLATEADLQGAGVAPAGDPEPGHKVFLVHGHDELSLHETARFLERLRQEVIVLRELPNEGRTIIEKFESYADVGFAVVLLTPDDRGGPATGPTDTDKPRARQNVIFELGYFIGKLGRNRVCALHRGGVELPSDFSGVVYVALDEKGAWRLELAKELRAAGLPVDMNHAL
jgi:predicted nucleotide-binding protein